MFNVSREFCCCYNQNKIQCDEDEGYEMFEFTQSNRRFKFPKIFFKINYEFEIRKSS